jgi:hypothetical protein
VLPGWIGNPRLLLKRLSTCSFRGPASGDPGKRLPRGTAPPWCTRVPHPRGTSGECPSRRELKGIHEFSFYRPIRTKTVCTVAAVSEIMGPRSAVATRPLKGCRHAEVAIRKTLAEPYVDLNTHLDNWSAVETAVRLAPEEDKGIACRGGGGINHPADDN